MAYDAYKSPKDYECKGAVTTYQKLGVDVLEKTSRSKMRCYLKARTVEQPIAKCIESHNHLLSQEIQSKD